MKRCPACKNRFPDSYTTCPDCGGLLRALSQEELDAEAEQAAREAEARKERLTKMREENKGLGALMAIAILSGILDLAMVILFFASGNFGGIALCVLSLMIAVFGIVFLQKPELLASRKAEQDSLSAFVRAKRAAMLLILLALLLTLVQIGIQASVFVQMLTAAEGV